MNSSVLRRAGPWAGLLVSRVPRRIVQPSPLEATIRSAAAWLADRRGEPGAGPALAAAINRQREDSTPYHLAHGLLDQSRYYLRHENADAAGDALAEARAIARQLSCVPLLERAAAIEPVTPRQRSHTA